MTEEYKAEVSITVPFHDVDSMGVVWHGYYLKYFEIARCKLLEQFNYSYKEMADSGYSWPVIDVKIRYAKPLFFEQEVVVEAKLVEWVNRLKVSYVVRDKKSQQRLTKGYTVQVAVDSHGEMLFESPKVLFDRLSVSATDI
jgi:acyl-CoA thioester hydrolase